MGDLLTVGNEQAAVRVGELAAAFYAEMLERRAGRVHVLFGVHQLEGRNGVLNRGGLYAL